MHNEKTYHVDSPTPIYEFKDRGNIPGGLSPNDKYDNLCIAIKSLKQELARPIELNCYHEAVKITKARDILDCYRAICVADDKEIRQALMWLAGIEEYYTGTFGKDKCLVWSEEARAIEEDSDSIYAQRVYEEGLCHYDDVDRVQEIAFDLFLEDKGVLIP